jgi:hypothetical protein
MTVDKLLLMFIVVFHVTKQISKVDPTNLYENYLVLYVLPVRCIHPLLYGLQRPSLGPSHA